MKKVDNIKKGNIILDIIFGSTNGRDTMKIKSIEIEGIGGIKELSLKFNDGVNLICGANGIGKTTILEAISHAFLFENISNLKKHADCNIGRVYILCKLEHELRQIDYKITEFNANKNELIIEEYKNNNNILVFKSNRYLGYEKLKGIHADDVLDFYEMGNSIVNGVEYTSIKGWFVNRFLFYQVENSIAKEQKHNFESALKCFEILDGKITFSKILADSLDIMVNTPQGEIYFEYLSSGYKSCFYILLGIIKEIEYRFKDPYIKVEDFEGVILIDELDLHLHPEWQVKIVDALKRVVPKAQIIATTHSPNMIQTLSPNEIIPLIMDENNNVCKKDLELGEYGLQGWTIEEILTDVMGMKTTSSELYLDTMRKFDRAMDKENIDEIKKYYDILMKMLHPKSTLRTILKIQVAGIID